MTQISPDDSTSRSQPKATQSGAHPSDAVFRRIDDELLEKLQDALKLKNYAIRNNYEISNQTISELNQLSQEVRDYFRSVGTAGGGLAQFSSPPVASSTGPDSFGPTAEGLMTRVDTMLRDLIQLTYPAAIELGLSASATKTDGLPTSQVALDQNGVDCCGACSPRAQSLA